MAASSTVVPAKSTPRAAASGGVASSTISSKGQVTVPIEIRRRLGLKEGDRVEFVVDHDLTVIRPARRDTNPFAKYKGALPVFAGKDEINVWVRGMRDEDAEER